MVEKQKIAEKNSESRKEYALAQTLAGFAVVVGIIAVLILVLAAGESGRTLSYEEVTGRVKGNACSVKTYDDKGRLIEDKTDGTDQTLSPEIKYMYAKQTAGDAIKSVVVYDHFGRSLYSYSVDRNGIISVKKAGDLMPQYYVAERGNAL